MRNLLFICCFLRFILFLSIGKMIIDDQYNIKNKVQYIGIPLVRLSMISCSFSIHPSHQPQTHHNKHLSLHVVGSGTWEICYWFAGYWVQSLALETEPQINRSQIIIIFWRIQYIHEDPICSCKILPELFERYIHFISSKATMTTPNFAGSG